MPTSKADDTSQQISVLKASSRRVQSDARGRQRQATREKIISAARVQFKSKRFHFTTVDEIVSYAGISRATFYTHFRGKEEVLLEIIIREYKIYHNLFHRLTALESIEEDSLTAWTLSFLEEFIEHRDWLFSYYVICDIYDDMANFFTVGRDKTLDILGGRFGVFRAGPDRVLADGVRARGHMLLYQLEQFALHASFPGWSIDTRTFARTIARSMLETLEEGEIGPPLSATGHKDRHLS